MAAPSSSNGLKVRHSASNRATVGASGVATLLPHGWAREARSSSDFSSRATPSVSGTLLGCRWCLSPSRFSPAAIFRLQLVVPAAARQLADFRSPLAEEFERPHDQGPAANCAGVWNSMKWNSWSRTLPRDRGSIWFWWRSSPPGKTPRSEPGSEQYVPLARASPS